MKRSSLETRELKLVLAVALVLVLLTSVPYLFGHYNRPFDGRFLWMTFNIDDFCVYQSWTRQVAEGNILMRNLYTNDPQPRIQFNLFFFTAGLIARATGLAPVVVLHLLRIILIVVLIWSIWRLSGLFFDDARARLIAAALTAFASGFGWMFSDSNMRAYLPVDRWQPEALVFLSSYLNPLFLAGLILLVWSAYYLIKVKREGRITSAVAAGFFLLLLGNIHTYDLVPLGIGWGIYLLALLISRHHKPWRTIGLSILAGAVALPSVLYQVHVYNTDPVFRARAHTSADSPSIIAYLLGFGFVFILAAIGAAVALRNRKKLFLILWSAAGLAAPYLPFAQQRKFIMGVEIPLTLLAVFVITKLFERRGWKDWQALTVLLIVAVIPTNIVFLQRDIGMIAKHTTAPKQRPYLAYEEIEAVKWIRDNLTSDDTLAAPPDPAVLIPALSGKQVYFGHWSETPDYSGRLNQWMAFTDPEAPDEWRKEWLKDHKITYVWYYDYSDDTETAESLNILPTLDGLSFLEPVYRSGHVVIYRSNI